MHNHHSLICNVYCMLSKQPECTNGWYGVNCSQQCSRHCISGTTCNHVTGLCDKGCDKGWTGSLCIKGKLPNQNIKSSQIKPMIKAEELTKTILKTKDNLKQKTKQNKTLFIFYRHRHKRKKGNIC